VSAPDVTVRAVVINGNLLNPKHISVKREMLKNIPFILLHSPIFITFSLKLICLMKMEDERGMMGACVALLR
jgi:hypothetical protein